jgi:hypothetical protein
MPTRRAVWRLLLAAVVGSAMLVGLTAAVPSTAERGALPADDHATVAGDLALLADGTVGEAIGHRSDEASPLPRSQDVRRTVTLAAVLVVAALLVLAVRSRHEPPRGVVRAAAPPPRVPGRRAPPLALPR